MRHSASDDTIFGRTSADPNSTFLTTPRAHAACQREFDRICSALVDEASNSLVAMGHRAPDVRRAPTRTVVQGRESALTLAWLCGPSASVDTGELLAIVWSGQVAERGDPIPERRIRKPSAPPVPLWESSLTPVAGAASAWAWRSGDGAVEPSPALASRLAQQFVAHLAPVATEEQV